MNESFKGYFFGILASIAYGMNPLFGLHLYREGMTTPSVLFYRFTLGVLMLGALMLVRKQSFRLPATHILPSVAGGLLLAVSCLLWFYSFRLMSSGIAATILFLYPIMVALIMTGMYHEKISAASIAGIVLALAGVVMLCRTEDGGAVSIPGIICIVFSALAYAIYIVELKVTRLKELSPELITFYAMLFGIPLYLIQLRGGIDLQPLDTWTRFGNALGVAFFPGFLSFLLMAMAIPRIGATNTAILGALEPLTAVCIGVAVFHEPMTIRLAIGLLLVLGSVTIVVSGNRFQDACVRLFRRITLAR